MNSTTRDDATPHAPLAWTQYLRPPAARICLQATLCAASIAVAAFIILHAVMDWSTGEANDAAGQRQTHLLGTVITQMEEQAGYEQETATISDEAVRATASGADYVWMDAHIGRRIAGHFEFDGVLVLDGNDRTAYAYLNSGTISANDLLTGSRDIRQGLRKRLREGSRLPKGASRLQTIGESGLLLLGGRPAFISVKPIVSETGAVAQLPGREALHVVLRFLDGNFLSTLGQAYQFDNIRFVSRADHAALKTTGETCRSHLDLFSSDGTLLGAVRWDLFKPGEGVRRSMTPVLMGASLAFGVLVSGLLLLVSRETRKLKESEASLRHLAYHDPLTGLLNQSRLGMKMDELARTSASDTVAAFYLDIDHFKEINDTFDRAAGDRILAEVARRLVAAAPQRAILSRLGGDEFVVVVPQFSMEEARQLAADFIAAIGEPIEIDRRAIQVATSVGLACDTVAHGADDLIRQADIALYFAKASGRNRYEAFSEHMDANTRERRLLAGELREALVTGEQIRLLYQPIYAAADGSLKAAEVLCRWHHPTRGVIAPDVFITLAEETGTIGRLGQIVAERAFAAARSWNLRLALNVSTVELKDPDYADRFLAVLHRSGLSPADVEVEITETAIDEVDRTSRRNIDMLRAAGISVALDDFGVGFSSLARLQGITVDRIKIDRVFVARCVGSSADTAIISCITSLARAMGLHTTAEGVETNEQRHVLRAMGCDELQGYLLSRPIDEDRMHDLAASARLSVQSGAA